MEELVYFLVDELYGKDAGHVSRALYLKNKSTFKQLLTLTSLPDQRLRNSLVLLIQQSIVTYIEKPKIVYFLSTQEAIRRIRYPRYIRLIQQKYSENSCIEELLENGCSSVMQLESSAKDSVRDTEAVSQTLREMIINDYLVPCDQKIETVQITPSVKPGRPKKKTKIELLGGIHSAEALPKRPEVVSDTFYKLNCLKLDKEMTSDLIGKFVSGKCNLNCAIISEVFYKLGYRSVTRAEVINNLPTVPKLSSAVLDQSLESLEKAEIITKDTEISWKINIPLIYQSLSAHVIEKIIQGKFGDYSGRVFRILFNKGLLDDKTISDLTLLPLKETNTCLNELFASGFVFTKTIGVNQLYYGVKIDDVKAEVLGQCYKAVLNLKIKLASEMEEIWSVAQRVGHLSNDERCALERYRTIETRVESAILELDRTVLILSLSQ